MGSARPGLIRSQTNLEMIEFHVFDKPGQTALFTIASAMAIRYISQTVL